MIDAAVAVTGAVPVQVPPVAVVRTLATVVPPIVVGTVTASACVADVAKDSGSVAGVVIANAIPAAAVTVMFFDALTDTAPVESSQSASITTVPAAVGVNVILGVVPVTPVVTEAAERVPVPVLVASTEKRMV